MPDDTANMLPPNPGDTLRRVLVIKLGGVGEFVRALGAMCVVRAAHRSARITLLTTPALESFAKACPYFDIVESDGRPDDIRGRTELVRRLKQANYDMVYDFQNSTRTQQYFSGLSGKKPLWSGAAPGASHEHLNPDLENLHMAERLADQLHYAGLNPGEPGDPSGLQKDAALRPRLDWIRPAFRDPPRFQPEYFGLYGPYALLMPGPSEANVTESWRLDKFVALAKWLADGGVTPAIVGGRSEGDVGMKINQAEQRAKNLIGRTDLFQLATLCQRALIAFGVNTGPIHVAAASGTPTICLFRQDWNEGMRLDMQSVLNAKTRLGKTAPRGDGVVIVYKKSLENISARQVATAGTWLGVLPDRLNRESIDSIIEKSDDPPSPKTQSSHASLSLENNDSLVESRDS